MGVFEGISSFVTGALNTLVGTNQAAKNRAFNEREAQKQRDFQLEMWNKENEYNLPVNQMARLEAAGLNPNLVYGDGATTLAAHVGSAAAAHASGNVSGQFENPLMAALMADKMKTEKDLIESEELVNRERAKSIAEERKGTAITNMFQRDSYQLRLDQLEAENRLKDALLNTEQVKKDELMANIDRIHAEESYIKGQTENEKSLTEAKIKEIEQSVENSVKLTAHTCANLDAQAAKANADAWLARAEATIKSNPEYQNAVIEKAVQDAYAAFCHANQAEIEESLMRLAESFKPEPGSSAYKYQRFIEQWINPATSAVGKVFGGSAGISITKKAN